MLKGEVTETPHESLYFIGGKKLMGWRAKDSFKYFDKAKSENTFYSMASQGPFLFNLTHDQNESYNVSQHFPEKEAAMRKALESKRLEMKTNPRGWKKK